MRGSHQDRLGLSAQVTLAQEGAHGQTPSILVRTHEKLSAEQFLLLDTSGEVCVMRRSATMAAAIGLGLGLALGTTGWAAAQPAMKPRVGEGECIDGGGTPIRIDSELLAPAGALECQGGTYDRQDVFER